MNRTNDFGQTADFERAHALTMQQIITFCEVYEKGGYVGASEALGLAGPTIWEQVKSLEKIYKTKLFDRTGRNIHPSVAGKLLYEMLRPLLASVDSTFEKIAEEANEYPQKIGLVTGARMMLEELGGPLGQFHQAYPQVKLALMTADNTSAQHFVLDGKADLALLIEPSPSMIAEEIHCERLYEIEYLVAMPRKHRLCRKTSITLEDLIEEELVVGNLNTIGRKMLEQARFRLGIEAPLKIVAETDNSAITIACVRAGLGIGLIASRPDGNLTKTVTTRSIASDVGRVYVVAAYRKGRILTKSLLTLLELVRQT
jgi:DNA-binding transcriptional LysR family regulator